MSAMLDVGPVNVSGAARGRKARVVWADGTLHVVHSADRIIRYPTTEPVLDGDYWSCRTDEKKTITFTRKGCGG